MKNFHLSLILSMVFMSSWGQTDKDTLYFKFNSNYITVKKNYEGVHAFVLKKEKFVTNSFKVFFTKEFSQRDDYKSQVIKSYPAS